MSDSSSSNERVCQYCGSNYAQRSGAEIERLTAELLDMEAKAIAATWLLPDDVMVSTLREVRDKAKRLLGAPDETTTPRKLTLVDFGYAPGGYLCSCHVCGEEFDGEKLAITCKPCAKRRLAENGDGCL